MFILKYYYLILSIKTTKFLYELLEYLLPSNFYQLLRKLKLLVSVRIFNRRKFLLDLFPKYSICAEIGVYRGDFSKEIRDHTKPKVLHLIDPWLYQEDEGYLKSLYGGKKGIDQANMDQIFISVNERFTSEIQSKQFCVHRGRSEDIINEFENEYFDWIYIDGNHLYEYVKKDLELYYDKVKKGGLIAGDDYREGKWYNGGVKKLLMNS